jgi:hypothetical protein
MNRVNRICRGLLCVVAIMAIGFTGRTAAAWQVYDSGDSAFFDIDYQVQVREAWRDMGSGSQGDQSTTDPYVRRNRLSFLGMANDTFGGAVQFEYNGGRRINALTVSSRDDKFDLTLQDAYATVLVSNALQFRVGKTKQVLTREIQEGCFDPLTSDRSDFILGPFTKNIWYYNKTTRDNGVAVLGNLFGDVIQYRLAVMEGNRYAGSTAPDNAGFRYTGRVHVSLLDPETGWGYRGSYLGKKQVLTLGAGYDIEQNAIFQDVVSTTDLVSTDGADYKAYTFDGFYEQPTDFGTFTLSGAYLKVDFDGAGTRGVDVATGATGERNGGYGKAAYMLGKVQVFGRYEKWSFANLLGVLGQKVTYTAGGVNYYINGQDLRLTLEVSKTGFEIANAVPDFTTVLAQFQARF